VISSKDLFNFGTILGVDIALLFRHTGMCGKFQTMCVTTCQPRVVVPAYHPS